MNVRPATTRAERRVFRDLPTRLIGSDPAFVPMLDVAFVRLHDRKRNPFWRHAEATEWIAWEGDEPVGRIGACVDQALLERAPGTGAVGFFDCADRPAAAAALFAVAGRWLRERGCMRARGPLNYSIHDTAGLLVEGYDTPPTVDTTWNPPYYGSLWEANGWRRTQDLLGIAGDVIEGGPPRVARFAELARRRGATVRSMDPRRFDEDAEALREVFNAAWDENWGHVPIGRDEFAYKAADMKLVLDPDLIRIAEADGKAVGIFLGLPDLNVAIRASRGRLWPFGWWRLLRAKKRRGRNRVLLLGVVPGYRRRGIEALLLHDSYLAWGPNYRWSEASWVLEDNAAMRNALALHNMFPYKRWRLYERDL